MIKELLKQSNPHVLGPLSDPHFIFDNAVGIAQVAEMTAVRLCWPGRS